MGDALMPPGVMSPPSDGDAKVYVKIEEENTKPALTPPTSEGTKGNHDDSSSDLSDLEPEEPVKPQSEPIADPKIEDEYEIVPYHYYEVGKIPVFKPVCQTGFPKPVALCSILQSDNFHRL